jgi:GT2 family glycosyltransferase
VSVPNVTINSPFRDNVDQVRPFARAIAALDYPPEHLRVVCVEGDSEDETLAVLKLWEKQNQQVTVVKHDTNEPKYPSVVSPARFAHLEKVFNKCIESIDIEWSDYSLLIPSDVSFSPGLVMSLVAMEKDIISPMFWMGDFQNGSTRFYDIWGFAKDGENFPPYSFAWYQLHFPAEPFQVDRVGGAMLCHRAVIEAGCRYTADEADHGLCRSAIEKGFEIWCHPGAHIVHR